MPGFGDTGCRDVSLHSNMTDIDGSQHVVLKAAKEYIEWLIDLVEKLDNNVSLQKPWLGYSDNPQTLLWAVSWSNYFLFTELHSCTTKQKEACT